MSLKIIYGRAGSGKTGCCFDSIKQMADEDKKILVLTPEHISLQTESSIAAINGIKKTVEIIVSGFGRLATTVFSKVGPVAADYADNCVKSMLIKRILLNNAKKLTVLAKVSEKDGFAASLLDTINSLKSAAISPENLRLSAQSADNILTAMKLTDIAFVYEKYENEFSGNFYNSDDNLLHLCEKIKSFELFKGYYVYIDGFNGFSKQQYDVIAALLNNAACVTVTCPTDTLENNEASVFFRGITMADKLLKLAYDMNVEVLPNTFLDKCYKLKGELLHIEKNLHSYPFEKYIGVPENLSVYEATDYYDEVQKTATEIFALCRDNGYRYKDVAVVFRKSDTYLPLLKKVFADYDIPLFANEKADVLQHPYIAYMLSAFDVVINKFSPNSLIKWIKADFHNVDKADVYLLENYIVAAGSNEKMWSNELKYNGGLDDDDFERVKYISTDILKSILKFSAMLKGRKTFKSVSTAFTELLSEDYIMNKYNQLAENVSLQKAEEYITVYNALVNVVNQINNVFGDSSVTAEKYLAILRSGLSGAELGQIPAVVDCVTVSEPDLYKDNKKVVFLLGVNEGVLPKGYINEGILSDNDKKLLESCGYEAPDNNVIKHKAENYLIYTVLTAASDKLFVSYSAADLDGNTVEPSRVITRLLDLFPDLKLKKGVFADNNEIDAVIPTFNRLVADAYKEYTPTLEQWYKENKPVLYNIIEKSRQYKNVPQMLRSDVIKALYGQTPYYSISKIEQYNRCAFAYFLNYGLRAKPRKENSPKSADLGTIMHEVIEKYTLYAKEVGFDNISKEQCYKLAQELTEQSLKLYLGENYFESRTGRTALRKISGILKGVLWNITGFYKESDYELYGCEVAFGGDGEFPPIEIELENGAVAKLTGKIDRVDILKAQDRYYVNVVDYKSSDKTIDYGKTFFGLQIQLPVYIEAICKFLSQNNNVLTVPAAMLYCKIDYSPVGGSRDYSEEKITEEIKNSLKMKGLIVDSIDVSEAMGKTYAVKPDVTKHQVEKMCTAAYKKIKSTIDEIMTGNISILPANTNGRSSCEYCDYATVCSFDPLFGNEQKIIDKISKEEYFEYVGKMD